MALVLKSHDSVADSNSDWIERLESKFVMNLREPIAGELKRMCSL